MDLPKELALGSVTNWVNRFHLRGTLNRWMISELKCKFLKRLSGTNKPYSAVDVNSVSGQQQLPMNITTIVLESTHRIINQPLLNQRNSKDASQLKKCQQIGIPS